MSWVILYGELNWVSGLLGIVVPVNALFAIALFCTLIILMSLTAILSHHNTCLLRLIQENAMLEQRVRELEARLGTAAAEENRVGKMNDEKDE